MIINGVDLTPYFRDKSIKGRGIVKHNVQLKDIVNKPGAYYQKKKRPPRVLIIEGDVRANNPEELRTTIDTLNGLLDFPSPVSVKFNDEPNMEYFGIPEESDEGDEYTFLHRGAIKIICPDPDKYGLTKTPAFAAGALTINYLGTAEAYPVISGTITAATSSIEIKKGTRSMKVNYNFIVGDTFSFDFKKRKITINGVINMPTLDLNKYDFFELSRGNNVLTITPSINATVTYREAWL